jgi:hypothetical protein
MWVAPLSVLAASVTLMVAAASVAQRRSWLALALSLTAPLVLPWFAGPSPLVRGLLALVTFVTALRVIDLVRLREPWKAWRRIVHVLSFIDTRLLRRERPRLELGRLLGALAWGALAVVAFLLVRDVAPRSAAGAPWLRLGGGILFAYAAIDAGYALVRAGYRAAGFVTPALHVWPVASLSVAELWGVRWARPVGHWLRHNCFLPLARRGHPGLGTLLGFAASGFGHAYPILVAVGPAMAALMLGYFVVQGLAVVAEPRLGVGKWPRPGRRAWTVVIMIATSPLFVEPALRVVLSDAATMFHAR